MKLQVILFCCSLLCLQAVLVQSCYIYYGPWMYTTDDVVTALDSTLYFRCEIYLDWEYYYDYYDYEYYTNCNLSIVWRINGTDYHASNISGNAYFYDTLSYDNITISSRCFPWGDCHTYLSIKAERQYNNTELYCQAQFVDENNIPYQRNASSPATIIIQGLLDSPPNLRVLELVDGTIEVVWDPPFTFPEVPILHYTVYINTHGTTEEFSIPTTSNQYEYLKLSCGSVTFNVSAWNEVGEGARSEPVTYVRKTLHKSFMDVTALEDFPGTVCVTCAFTSDSESVGCYGELHKIESLTSQFQHFNATREGGKQSILHCITGLETGIYTVKIGEVECSGVQGPVTHVEWHNVSVIGQPIEISINPTAKESSEENADSALAGLAAVIATLGIALVVCAVVIGGLLVYTRRSRNYQVKGDTTDTHHSTRRHNPYDVGSKVEDEECMYETVEEQSNYETVEMGPIPAQQQMQATVRKPPAGNIGTGPCAAYGFVRS